MAGTLIVTTNIVKGGTPYYAPEPHQFIMVASTPRTPYRRQSPRTVREAGLEAFVARGVTNAATAGEPIVLRALDGSSGRGAYLLILN